MFSQVCLQCSQRRCLIVALLTGVLVASFFLNRTDLYATGARWWCTDKLLVIWLLQWFYFAKSRVSSLGRINFSSNRRRKRHRARVGVTCMFKWFKCTYRSVSWSEPESVDEDVMTVRFRGVVTGDEWYCAPHGWSGDLWRASIDWYNASVFQAADAWPYIVWPSCWRSAILCISAGESKGAPKGGTGVAKGVFCTSGKWGNRASKSSLDDEVVLRFRISSVECFSIGFSGVEMDDQ